MRRLAAATRRSSLHLSSDASRDAQHVAHGCILQRFSPNCTGSSTHRVLFVLAQARAGRPGKHQVLHAAALPAFLILIRPQVSEQVERAKSLLLRAAAASIVHSSTWPIVQAVVAVVSCRVLQLFRPFVRVLAFARPLVRPSSSPAHCFDSYCQIYIKFITTHVVSTKECCILLHLIEELKM